MSAASLISGSATAFNGRRSSTRVTSAGLSEADSTECAPDTPQKVIYKLRDLLGVDDLGGTMRLGSYECVLKPGSKAHTLYGADLIHERHRHRYEFNCLYEKALTDTGLEIVGRSEDGKFVEILELPSHPVVRGRAVPSRVQVEAVESPPALCRLRAGEPRAQACDPAPRDCVRGRMIAVRPVEFSGLSVGSRRCPLVDCRPVCHRKRVARRRNGHAGSRDRPAHRRPVRVQSLLRQGESDVGPVVSRAWPARRASSARPGEGEGSASRSSPTSTSRRTPRPSPRLRTSCRYRRSCRAKRIC